MRKSDLYDAYKDGEVQIRIAAKGDEKYYKEELAKFNEEMFSIQRKNKFTAKMDYEKGLNNIPHVEFYTSEKQDLNEKISCSEQYMECHFRYCTMRERVYFDKELEVLFARREENMTKI